MSDDLDYQDSPSHSLRNNSPLAAADSLINYDDLKTQTSTRDPSVASEKRSLTFDQNNLGEQLVPVFGPATIHIDLDFINSMVPFQKDNMGVLKPMVPEGVEKFYSASATSPLLPAGYSMLPEPLSEQSQGPRYIM